jgi:hypothetical protein
MPQLSNEVTAIKDGSNVCYSDEDHWTLGFWIEDLTAELEDIKVVCKED